MTMCDEDSMNALVVFDGVHKCSRNLGYICSPSRAYMSLENGHICSNKFDEKAHCAHMFLEEYSYVLTKLMKKWTVHVLSVDRSGDLKQRDFGLAEVVSFSVFVGVFKAVCNRN
nr:hypothetical protein [Tanacetum cinerariifolium]